MGYIPVTNDDGVSSPGIQALFAALHPLGRPVIIAPDQDNSAISHDLTNYEALESLRKDWDIPLTG